MLKKCFVSFVYWVCFSCCFYLKAIQFSSFENVLKGGRSFWLLPSNSNSLLKIKANLQQQKEPLAICFFLSNTDDQKDTLQGVDRYHNENTLECFEEKSASPKRVVTRIWMIIYQQTNQHLERSRLSVRSIFRELWDKHWSKKLILNGSAEYVIVVNPWREPFKSLFRLKPRHPLALKLSAYRYEYKNAKNFGCRAIWIGQFKSPFLHSSRRSLISASLACNIFFTFWLQLAVI